MDPHSQVNLNKVENTTGAAESVVYSYTEAWKRYISQNIVSRHAQRIIVQFMAACCGKSKTMDCIEDDSGGGTTRECPPSDLLFE